MSSTTRLKGSEDDLGTYQQQEVPTYAFLHSQTWAMCAGWIHSKGPKTGGEHLQAKDHRLCSPLFTLLD